MRPPLRPAVARFFLITLPLLMAPALVPAPADCSEPANLSIVAGPECVKGEPRTDAVSISSQGVTFSARPLVLEEWEARLEKRAPGSGGLLRGHDGKPAAFQVFLLKVESRNKDLVRFQPGNVIRLGGKYEEDHLLDYTDLYRYLQGIGKSGEDIEPVRDEFFDSGMILEAGQPVERMVFFRDLPVSKKRRTLTLLISSYQVGTETHRAALAWHFDKGK